MASQTGPQNAPKDQAFFSEEATRHILLRVANVFQDADLCDATFAVGDGDDREEIMAPSQIMALSSSYFKELFYPAREDKRREIEGVQPKTFRKILDYLFRGRVPLGSIEDAWKVKVAGRMFELKELEELCTKFLKYRIDSKNLVHFLKNTSKYNTPDLREVVISRFVKDATNAFQNEQVLDLSQQEMQDIMEKKPEIAAKKVVDVLIKWARKSFLAELKTKEEAKVKEEKDAKETTKNEEVKVDESKEIEEKAQEPSEGVKKDETNQETEKDATAEKIKDKPEASKDMAMEVTENKSECSDDISLKDKPITETSEDVKNDKDTKEIATCLAPKEVEENFILPLENLIKHVSWNHNDAEYYLKEVHAKKILSEDNKNNAMAQMLQAFVDLKPISQQSSSAPVRIGPKSAQQQRATPQNRNQKGAQKRTSDGDCDVVMERISKASKPASPRVKTEDEILL